MTRHHLLLTILASVCLCTFTGCISGASTASRAAGIFNQPLDARKTDPIEATEFSKCIDETGKTSGQLNSIWRTKNSAGENIPAYMEGFSGRFKTLRGESIEFQSLLAVEEKLFLHPWLVNIPNFPLGSYASYRMQFLEDDMAQGLATLKVNGSAWPSDDFTEATLYIPRFAIGSEFATRYYLKINNDVIHELSCQAVNDDMRTRLMTFAAKDGTHGFSGSRGTRTAMLVVPQKILEPAAISVTEVQQKTDPTPVPQTSALRSKGDLRHARRPKTYDTMFKHVRIFECENDSALDVIWRVADRSGRPLSKDQQFISGFAGSMMDVASGTSFEFSSISADPNPAFYAGKMPPQAQYFFPSIHFDANDVKANLSHHSPLPGTVANFVSPGGTVFIPRDGSGRGVSVSLAREESLRGESLQATIQCKAAKTNIAPWINHCLGQDNRKSAGAACQP